jgi:ubiquinone biosynthesis protein UbiJ
MKTPLLLTSLFTAAIETPLNHVLFKDNSSKVARQRLAGKVLRIVLAELDTPLTLLFHPQQVDVVSDWLGEVDCCLTLHLSSLAKLRDRQQLSPMIRSGELVLEGDIQVVQRFGELLELGQWDVAEWLSPYLGDIAAESLVQLAGLGWRSAWKKQQQWQGNLAQTLTEEWKLVPSALQVAWFNDEVAALVHELDVLENRLSKLEASS